MNLKVSIKSIYNNLSFAFFSLSAMVLIIYYYTYPDFYFFLEPITAFLLFSPIAISIFLFFDYLRFETNRLIILKDDMLYIEKRSVKRQIYSDQIKEVKLCAAPVFYRNSMFRLLPFEVFHYAEIKVENQPSVYLTSLSDTKLFYWIQEEPLFKGKITYKKSLFNSIAWNSLD